MPIADSQAAGRPRRRRPAGKRPARRDAGDGHLRRRPRLPHRGARNHDRRAHGRTGAGDRHVARRRRAPSLRRARRRHPLRGGAELARSVRLSKPRGGRCAYPLSAVPRRRRVAEAGMGGGDAPRLRLHGPRGDSRSALPRALDPIGHLGCSVPRWPGTSSRCSSLATSQSTCPGSWARATRSTSSACRPPRFRSSWGLDRNPPGRRGRGSVASALVPRAGACATSRRRSPSTQLTRPGNLGLDAAPGVPRRPGGTPARTPARSAAAALKGGRSQLFQAAITPAFAAGVLVARATTQASRAVARSPAGREGSGRSAGAGRTQPCVPPGPGTRSGEHRIKRWPIESYSTLSPSFRNRRAVADRPRELPSGARLEEAHDNVTDGR